MKTKYVRAFVFVAVLSPTVTTTSTLPDAWGGVTTVSVTALSTLNVAGTPPIVTVEFNAVVKPEPVIVICWPPVVMTLDGVIELIVVGGTL